MKILIAGLCLLSLVTGVCQEAPAQSKASKSTGQSAILYGKNFSYAVSEPKGWVLDSEAGKSQNLSVVFYKQGQSWQNGDAVIYINLSPRRKGVSLEREAKEDVNEFLKRDPDLLITSAPPLKTHDGRKALTFTFMHRKEQPPFEETAYIQMPTIIQTVVLTAKTRTSYTAVLPVFKAVTHSLWFLTEKVNIKK